MKFTQMGDIKCFYEFNIRRDYFFRFLASLFNIKQTNTLMQEKGQSSRRLCLPYLDIPMNIRLKRRKTKHKISAYKHGIAVLKCQDKHTTCVKLYRAAPFWYILHLQLCVCGNKLNIYAIYMPVVLFICVSCRSVFTQIYVCVFSSLVSLQATEGYTQRRRGTPWQWEIA